MKQNHEQLGEEKISKLLWQQSTPAMIGLLFVSIYNFVDAIFIGQGVGPLGIAGLAVALPIHMIIMALAQTIGVGSASIISRALGAGHHKKAAGTLGHFFTLIILVSAISSGLGLIFLHPLLELFGASKDILPYSADYLGIILMGTIFLSFAAGGNNVIRAEGNAKFAMIVITISAVINLILDPIFIFGFDMGMQGAALATIIGFFIAAVIAGYYFAAGKGSIPIKLSDLKLNFKITKEIFSVGAASFARQAAASFMVVIINNSLKYYGADLAIAAYGIIMRITMLIFMPMFGIVQGMQPILGYNYGADKLRRAREVIIKAILISTYIAIGAFIILFIFAEGIISWFTTDQGLISLTAGALRIVILALPLTGIQVVGGGLFQSIGKSVQAFIISILRQVLCLLPAILIIPIYLGLDGIFIAVPVADFAAAFIVIALTVRQLKHFGRHSETA